MRRFLCKLGLLLTLPLLVGCPPSQVPWKPAHSDNDEFEVNVSRLGPGQPGLAVFSRLGAVPVPLWNFDHDTRHGSFFVSNDGEVVVYMRWGAGGQVGPQEPLLEFITRQGVIKTHLLSQLCAGTVNHSFQLFGGYKPMVYRSTQRDNTFIVTTFEDVEVTFDLATGAILGQRRVWTWLEILALTTIGINLASYVTLSCLGVSYWRRLFPDRHHSLFSR